MKATVESIIIEQRSKHGEADLAHMVGRMAASVTKTKTEGWSVGEKGNVPVDNPIEALDAIPFDVLKSSPETVNAWIDTYLKYREVRALQRSAEAAESSAEGAQGASDRSDRSDASAS